MRVDLLDQSKGTEGEFQARWKREYLSVRR